MKTTCLLCGRVLKVFDSKIHGDQVVSHGLCDACLHHSIAQMGASIQEFIEGFTTPVAVLSREGRVLAVNQRAEDMIGKPPNQIKGFLGGEVFECENSHLPQGCGKTKHCNGCDIRNSILKTYKENEGQARVTSFLRRVLKDGSIKDVVWTFSTSIHKGVVFLSIESEEC